MFGPNLTQLRSVISTRLRSTYNWVIISSVSSPIEEQLIKLLTQSGDGLTRGGIAERLRADPNLPTFSDSTLKRLLRSLADRGRVRPRGKTKGTRYYLASGPHREHSSEQQTFAGIFSPASLELVAKVRQPPHARSPIGYQLDLLRGYVPDQTEYLSQTQRQRLDQLGRRVRGAIRLPAGTYARKILERLLIDLSFNSSRLEGNTYTLLDTEKLIASGQPAEDKSFEERTMILNHKEAVQYLVDNAEEFALTPFLIRNLHYALTQDLLPNPKAPGSIRQIAVNIGKSVYTPLAVPQMLEECLALICSKASKISDPFEQSLFLLAHISYLQAFEDGNKRTARLASNVPLVRDNLCPNAYADIPREAYTLAMVVFYELNEIGALADAFTFAYQRSALRYDVVIETTAAPDEFRLKHRSARKQVMGEIIRAQVTRREVQSFTDRWLEEQGIPSVDHDLFRLHVIDDLDRLNVGRLAGLGVSATQFEHWRARFGEEKGSSSEGIFGQ